MQGNNVAGVGREEAQTHRRHKMGFLAKGCHPKSDGLQCFTNQGAKLPERRAGQGSF
jgi:hypothetical protein